jgi:3-hydroxybutyryl-CoA dehydratase
VTPGQAAQFEKTVSEADVVLYLGLTGDELSAYWTKLEGLPRPAPSIMAVGYIATAFSRLLTPPQRAAIVTRYQLTFPARIYVGDTLTTTVTVVDASDSDGGVTVDATATTHEGGVAAQGRVGYRLL